MRTAQIVLLKKTGQIFLINYGSFVDFPCTTMGLKPDINVRMTEEMFNGDNCSLPQVPASLEK